MTADELTYRANRIGKIGSFARREQEWALQSKLAAGETTHVYKQLRAGQIREAIAKREWKNHQQQMRQAEEIESFLTDEKTRKTTNRTFYTWMRREVKGLYGQCFQFAFDIARKAERALQHELGDPELSYLQFDYETIADVILHIRYTAREGGNLLRNAAMTSLNTCIDETRAAGSVRLFSVRHEFPTEWAKFKGAEIAAGKTIPLTLRFKPEHYPYWSQGRLEVVKRARLFARTDKSVTVYGRVNENGQPDEMTKNTLGSSLGNLRAGELDLGKIDFPRPVCDFTLYFVDSSAEDLWLAVAWGK